ncbi:MAG: hypothetical protein Q9174_006097, partial [Haloplaca sp. 1 TL-2023]
MAPTDDAKPAVGRASFVRHMVRNHISKLVNRLNGEGTATPDQLPPRPDDKSQQMPPDTKICIVGGGISGLYAGLIFDHLGIPYDILEAAPRPGGRILTHYFSTRPHDYYDIGAMRFPKVSPMERAGLDDKIIDYHLSGANNPKRYNGVTVFPPKDGAAVEDDPFGVSESKGGMVPDEYAPPATTSMKTVGKVLEEAMAPLKEALKRGDAESFKMFEECDDYTVRSNLDFETIQWLEETDSATGLFDLAFTEAVMDSIAFDYSATEEEEWKSIEGGTNLVTEAVVDMLKTKPTYNKRVTRIALDRKREGENKMVVVTNYDEAPRYYTSVINTTTLACLQRIDTTDLELSPTVKIATRTLHYDSSTKVGIKFDKPWWITKLGITGGGVSNTDLPIRVCVYPSYNLKDDPEKPAVLLATYT